MVNDGYCLFIFFFLVNEGIDLVKDNIDIKVGIWDIIFIFFV